MVWDEKTFGLIYDLDWFNVVAVPSFNCGAMENKSLNIFNSRLLLASKDTSTDSNFLDIMRVVGQMMEQLMVASRVMFHIVTERNVHWQNPNSAAPIFSSFRSFKTSIVDCYETF